MKPGPKALLATAVALAAIVTGCRTKPPQISPPTGIYPCPEIVTITRTPPNAAIYYTTDGSTPTSSSAKYSAPFAVPSSSTVQAIAIAPGSQASTPASVSYTCALTRADFAVLAQQKLFLSAPSFAITFTDVRPSDEIYPAIQAIGGFMNAQVLCPGCSLSTNYFPNEPVSRGVATVALVRILVADNKIQLLSPAESKAVLANINDAGSLPSPSLPYFATAIKNGILSVTAGGSIQPSLPNTRDGMSAMLDHIQKQFNVQPGVIPQ